MLSTLAVASLSGISGAGQMNSALAKAAGYIDQVRGFAVAHSTYTYVGYRVPEANEPDQGIIFVAVASNSGEDLSYASVITVNDTVNQIGRALPLSRVVLTPPQNGVSGSISVGGKTYTTLAGFGPSGALDFNKSTPRDLQFSLAALNGSTNNIAKVKITGLTGSTQVIRQ